MVSQAGAVLLVETARKAGLVQTFDAAERPVPELGNWSVDILARVKCSRAKDYVREFIHRARTQLAIAARAWCSFSSRNPSGRVRPCP